MIPVMLQYVIYGMELLYYDSIISFASGIFE